MKRLCMTLWILCIALVMQAQIKVLGIGNSFSEDALEQNISEIALADGTPMIIANMYIGGCSIDRHVGNIEGNKADYRYTKFTADGQKTIREKVSLESIINEEEWDYISVQQVSGQSGFYESYARINELISWIKKKVPGAKILMHQTWAYGVGSNHSDFPKYDSSQEKMYDAICNAVSQVAREQQVDGVIPSGPAIQELRKMTGDYDLTRDGYHMSLGMGRYTLACVWYSFITGRNANKIKFYPDGHDPRTKAITAQEAKLCRKAAAKMVKKYR